MTGNPFLEYWYFHIPNYVLAILMYMVLGRFVLSFFFNAQAENVIWKAFVTVTNPAVLTVAAITPRIVHYMLLLLLTFVWLFVARVIFTIVMAANGLIPSVPGQ
ncbi:MAG: YggT family protein [Pseudomonadota bacterium]